MNSRRTVPSALSSELVHADRGPAGVHGQRPAETPEPAQTSAGQDLMKLNEQQSAEHLSVLQ